MVFINEWLPNPYGSSATDQFIELFNGGSGAVALDGWRIEKANGKRAWLDGRAIPPGGYLVLARPETRLALAHSNEKLFLYDARGRLVDHALLFGLAKKGKSFSRADYAPGPQQHFMWSDPTPGRANFTASAAAVLVRMPAYPVRRPINDFSLGAVSVLECAAVAAAILAALVVYFVNHDEKIRNILFDGNEAAG